MISFLLRQLTLKNRLWTGITKDLTGCNLTLTGSYSSSHLLIIMAGRFALLPFKFPSVLSLENSSLQFLCTETSHRIPEPLMRRLGNCCRDLPHGRGFLVHRKSPYFKVNAKMDSEVKSAIAKRKFRAEKSI